MTFKRWITITGLTESSAKKYSGAVFGSISEWARDAGLVDSSLIEISDPLEFENLAKKIKRLPIFIERNKKGNNMYSSALYKYFEYLSTAATELEQDIEDILTDQTKSETDKLMYIKSRIGQGEFRNQLLSYWKGCAVTGYKTPSLLIASHIKPWRDSDNRERLDRFNGLLLTPNIDKAFDNGFLSFDKKGRIMISNIFENPKLLGINNEMSVTLHSEHRRYMEYHRDVVFISF